MKFKQFLSFSSLILFKALLISIIPVSILTTSILYSKNDSVKKLENKIEAIGSKEELNYDYKNALLEDTNQKATSDSVLVYFINWNAVFHRFGIVSHLIKILEKNPQKEIYFFHRSNAKIDLSEITNNSKYSNFHYFNFTSSFNFTDFNSFFSQEFFPQEIIKTINDLEKKQNKKIDFYADDYLLLNSIKFLMDELNKTSFYNISGWNKVKERFAKNFSILNGVNSVNLFADGTASMNFFSNTLYDAFLFSGNKLESNNKYLSQTITDSSGINDFHDLMLYLLSFVTTNEKGNNIQTTKYFLPTRQMVNEANFPDSILLNNKKENDFFNPYNSLEADLISFCKALNIESKQLLNNVFSKEKLNENDFLFMENNTNYIYSGRLLNMPDIVLAEARKLLEIKKIATNNPNIKNYNIIFKGHPRDEIQDIIDKLKVAIKRLDPSDNAEWLHVINPKIPYEIYLVNGIFSNDPSKNKIVKLFTTFSTINLFLYAEDPSLDNIENILVNQKEVDDINYYFTSNSLIFPKNKFKIS
ncbi:MAG: hypothetical protein ACRC9U_01595 [Metamycoplasmataceae bacterium]